MSDRQTKIFKSALAYGVAIFGNVNEEGKISFSVKKSYKDKDSGEYKESKTYFGNELAALVFLVPQALAWMDEMQGGKRKGETADFESSEKFSATDNAAAAKPKAKKPSDEELPW